MDEISSIYWMLLIAGLSAFLAFIMYQFAMLLGDLRKTIQEATVTVRKSNEMLDDAKIVVESAKKVVTTVEGSVNEINETVMTPIRNLSGMLGIASSFVSGLKGDGNDRN